MKQIFKIIINIFFSFFYFLDSSINKIELFRKKKYYKFTKKKFTKNKGLLCFSLSSPDGLIRKDILDFLNDIKSICNIVIISDKKINEDQKKKIHCNQIFIRDSFGRDFGNYKFFFKHILLKNSTLINSKYLVIANDSVFYKKYNYKKIFNLINIRMKKDYFSGLTTYMDKPYNFHFQSYFMFFSNKILNNNHFQKFWKNYSLSNNRLSTIQKGEILLSQYLIQGCNLQINNLMPLFLNKIKKNYVKNTHVNLSKKIVGLKGIHLQCIVNEDFPLFKIDFVKRNILSLEELNEVVNQLNIDKEDKKEILKLNQFILKIKFNLIKKIMLRLGYF